MKGQSLFKLPTISDLLGLEGELEMKFWRRRKQERLYKQWTEHAELSPEAIPPPETPTEIKAWVQEEGWFYRFRVRILDMVRKILRVD